MKSIIGITPARGGSKRIPRKNLQIIAGKPLIAWTIEAALKSKYLDMYVVSTDDVDITLTSHRYGALVIHRPPDLATDTTPTLPVLQHVLELIEDIDIIVLLQCTSPIRDSTLIDYCIKTFKNTSADSIATGNYSYIWGDGNPHFLDDGNVYVMRAENIRDGNMWGEKMIPVVSGKEQSIEIDDPYDMWIAEKILEKRDGL